MCIEHKEYSKVSLKQYVSKYVDRFELVLSKKSCIKMYIAL